MYIYEIGQDYIHKRKEKEKGEERREKEEGRKDGRKCEMCVV
jgi:hypothetical protein